jgi:hypothetical protein
MENHICVFANGFGAANWSLRYRSLRTREADTVGIDIA